MQAVWQNILETLQSWWGGFVENLPNYLAGLLILLVSIYLARLISSLASRGLKRRKTDPEIALLLTRLVRWGLIALGVILALQQAGQDVTALLTGLGILGFTVGFALQDVSKNFIAGILLLIQQPFELGDAIQVADYGGTVMSINLRDTELLSFDGLRVRIPNADIFTNAITNYTRTKHRRLAIKVGVACNSDLKQVNQVALEAISAIPGVMDDPAPAVVFEEFGDFSINLTIYYWLDLEATSYWDGQSSGLTEINAAFESAGIEIPYPTQVRLEKA